MDWDQSYYVRLYRSQSPDWLGLPALTRGLFAELLLLADRAGTIPLGRAGLKSIAVPLRDRWEDIAPHVTRLLEDGAVELAPGETALVIPNFTAAQAKPKTSTERSQEHRARNAGDAPPAPATPATPKPRRKRAETPPATDATPDVAATSGDDTQRDATPGNGGDACNDTNKQTDKQTDLPPTPLAGGPEVEFLGSDAPADAALWKAYIQGVSQALAQSVNFVRHETDTQALRVVWDMVGAPKGMTHESFLTKLRANAERYVRAARDAGRDPLFEKFYKPEKFLAWLQRDAAGSPAFPYADGPGPKRGGERLEDIPRTAPRPPAVRPNAEAVAAIRSVGGGGR